MQHFEMKTLIATVFNMLKDVFCPWLIPMSDVVRNLFLFCVIFVLIRNKKNMFLFEALMQKKKF